LFAVLYVAVASLWHVPHRVAALYVGVSLVCALAYAMDKAAAERKRWRTSEQSLLFLGLIGGWPGALVAQQYWRHKTVKASFRTTFWLTVVFNVALFLALAHPSVRSWLP